MLKYILVAALACTASLLAASDTAQASWHYQPQGKRITIQQAAANIAAGTQPSEITFAENQMFVEFTDYKTPANSTYALTTTVAAFENAVDAKIPAKILGDKPRTSFAQGWNKLAKLSPNGTVEEMVYSAFDDFRGYLKDSAPLPGGFKNENDSRGYITHLYGPLYTLLSLVGDDVTYYREEGGDSGGAHGWAGAGMIHKNYGYRQDSLLDLVDNQQLLDSLKANPILRKAAGDELDSITQITDFDRRGSELTEILGNGTRWSITPGQQWTEFSLYAYDPATKIVTIRLGLQYVSEAERGSFSQLEVRARATDDFADTLDALANGKIHGQLMKDVPAAQQPPTDGR
jgi:hypothetical protein